MEFLSEGSLFFVREAHRECGKHGGREARVATAVNRHVVRLVIFNGDCADVLVLLRFLVWTGLCEVTLLTTFKASASLAIFFLILLGGGLANGGRRVYGIVVVRGETQACWPRVSAVILV